MTLEGKDIALALLAAFVGGLITGGHAVMSMNQKPDSQISEHSIPGAVWIGTVPAPAEIVGE